MKKLTLSVPLGALLLLSSALAADMSEQAIKERIEPVGQVYLDGELPEVATASTQETAPSGPRDGATVYQSACVACHGSGAAGAPIKDNAEQWGPRLEKGMDTLMNHALNGFNAMPPKGTCMDCSEAEIKAAVEYMIEGL